jgi:hypothetical protein
MSYNSAKLRRPSVAASRIGEGETVPAALSAAAAAAASVPAVSRASPESAPRLAERGASVAAGNILPRRVHDSWMCGSAVIRRCSSLSDRGWS